MLHELMYIINILCFYNVEFRDKMKRRRNTCRLRSKHLKTFFEIIHFYQNVSYLPLL